MIRLPKYIFGIYVILLLFSCRTQKPVAEIKGPDKLINESHVPEDVFNTGHSFKTMKVKRMNVDFIINGVTDNFNGKMAVSRDSLIVISVIPVFGYEALRILCTKDSIIVINRTEKTYHASSLDYYLKKYNITAGFKDLQAVLVNEVFYYTAGYKDIEYEKTIEMQAGNMLYIINSLLGNIKLTNQTIAADSACFQIRDVFVIDYQRGVKMAVRYNDFNGCEMDSFPNSIIIDIQDKRNDINLDIEYGQVIFDDEINVKFEIPESYSRIYM
jgi:hypothetical protein